MLTQQQNHPSARHLWFVAAFVLPLLALFTLLNATTRPALGSDPAAPPAAPLAHNGRSPEAGGILITPTGGLTTTEAGGVVTFTAVLTNNPTASVMITLTSSDTSEGVVSVAALTFTQANWDEPQTVTVTGVNDFVDDGNVAYTIITAPAVSGDPDYNGLNAADVNVVNADNDTAGILVNPTSGLLTSEGGLTDTFTIVLTSQPTADVTMNLSSSDSGEGTVAPSSLTFTPANWNQPRTVTVTGVNDDIDDGNQPYNAVTGAASSADDLYDGLNPSDVSVTNQDNDAAGILIDPIAGLVTGEDGSQDTFTVVLTSEPAAAVTIDLSSNDTGEGTIDNNSLLFNPGNWDNPQTVTVTGVDDLIDDGDQPYLIVTDPASSSDPNYNGLNAADPAVTNLDNDGASISVDPVSGLVTTEAGGTDSFTVHLDTEPTADVTIGFSSSDSSEGTVAPGSLTFTPENWNTPQTVTVTGVDDNEADGDVLYTAVSAPAVSTDPAYDGVNPADVSVTNEDDDAAAVMVSPTTGLVTSEDGDSDSFGVRLNSQPASQVVIPLNSSDQTEGTISATSLTFTTQNWATWQYVTVTGVDDDLDDGDIAYTIVTGPATSSDPNYSGFNPADVQAVNLDRDTRTFMPAIVAVPHPVWEQVGDEPAGLTRFYTVAVCGATSFAGADNGYGLYRLVGDTWQQQTDDGLPTLLVSGMAFTSDCRTLFVGTRGQGTWRGDETPGGWDWQRVDTPTPAGDNNVWAVVLRGDTVYVGTDGGLFWATLPTGPQTWNQTNVTDWVTGLTLNEDDTIYAAVWDVGVFQASPGSHNWTQVGKIGNPLVYQAAKTTNNYQVAGTQTQIYRWGGSNWQAVSQFASTTFAVAAANSRLYAGQRNNGVLVSEDGGVTWATMNDEMAMPVGEEFQVRGFFIDSAGYLYAATTSGVWRWSAPIN